MPSSAVPPSTPSTPLSLPDALPICRAHRRVRATARCSSLPPTPRAGSSSTSCSYRVSPRSSSRARSARSRSCSTPRASGSATSSSRDRKSTRLNSSHLGISYAVFCCSAVHPLYSPLPTRRSSDLPSPPSGARYGKVFVAPADAARGLEFDVVFVPGLAEKLFPRKIGEEPILLDPARERLGDELVTNERRRDAERLALRLAVGAARQRAVLSYPRVDVDGSRP